MRNDTILFSAASELQETDFKNHRKIVTSLNHSNFTLTHNQNISQFPPIAQISKIISANMILENVMLN